MPLLLVIDIALATGGITYSKEPTIISVPRLEVRIAIIFTRFAGSVINPELEGNVNDDKLNPLGLGLGELNFQKVGRLWLKYMGRLPKN